MRKKNWRRKPKSARERFMDRWEARIREHDRQFRAEALVWQRIACNNPDLFPELEQGQG